MKIWNVIPVKSTQLSIWNLPYNLPLFHHCILHIWMATSQLPSQPIPSQPPRAAPRILRVIAWASARAASSQRHASTWPCCAERCSAVLRSSPVVESSKDAGAPGALPLLVAKVTWNTGQETPRHGSLVMSPFFTSPNHDRYMVFFMATIRWCPIFPKWDIYQPLQDSPGFTMFHHGTNEETQAINICYQSELGWFFRTSDDSSETRQSVVNLNRWNLRQLKLRWISLKKRKNMEIHKWSSHLNPNCCDMLWQFNLTLKFAHPLCGSQVTKPCIQKTEICDINIKPSQTHEPVACRLKFLRSPAVAESNQLSSGSSHFTSVTSGSASTSSNGSGAAWAVGSWSSFATVSMVAASVTSWSLVVSEAPC